VTFTPGHVHRALGDRGLFVAYSACCLSGAAFVWTLVPQTAADEGHVHARPESAGDAPASTSATAV